MQIILRRFRTLVDAPIHIKDNGFATTDESQYLVLREALANMVMHSDVPVKLTDTQQKVLELIKSNSSITHLEMFQRLSINEKTAKRATQVLRELGLIKREGIDKTGQWILFDKNKD